jgi:hypothetical protein
MERMQEQEGIDLIVVKNLKTVKIVEQKAK